MTALRIAITVFTLILLFILVLGWRWTGAHQPPPARLASHLVLGISTAAGVFAIVRIWTVRPRQSRGCR
jgi:hypothetical protein